MGVLSQPASANRGRGVLFSDREMDGDTNPSSLGRELTGKTPDSRYRWDFGGVS